MTRRFTFFSKGLPADTFAVVSFTGEEGLSMPYEFAIDLVSTKADLEMEDVVSDLSELKILRKEGDLSIKGILARLDQLHRVDNYVFYRAVLVPRLWALKLTSNNQVFLDKSAPEFIQDVLLGTGMLSGADVEFRLMQSYPKREYVCQYNESHFDFVSRWMEREGMYYFFEQSDRGEKMVITDTNHAHEPLPTSLNLRYSDRSAMEIEAKEALATAFVCEQSLAPHSVMVKDYNYRTPSLELKGQSNVDDHGVGTVYVYGDNFKTSGEAGRQASIRAEMAKSKQKMFRGEGTAPFVRSGYLFTLENHYRGDFNQQYLPVRVRHEGNQSGFLMSGLGQSLSDSENNNFYRNAFLALAADVQYRPERNTNAPRIYGTLNAVVDAEGSGKYAELDEQGRYKVRLPFDVSGRGGGKASSWIRMAKPYGGDGHGMHFPLHKGTEVLLTFIDGDPDRPIIAAAVPNFEKKSVVTQDNAPANAIKSASGNQLVMGDKEGQEFIGMWSPFHNSGIAVGSSKPGGGGSISMSTDGDFDSFTAGAKNEFSIGASNSLSVGVTNDLSVGLKNEITAAVDTSWSLAAKISYVKGPEIDMGDAAVSLTDDEELVALNELTLGGGVNAAVEKLMLSAKVALGLGVGGSLAAGAGMVGLSAPFDDGFLKDSSLGWKMGSGIAGYISLLTGGGLCLLSALEIKSIVDSFQAMQSNAKTGNIALNKSGVDIRVNTAAGNAPTFNAEVNQIGPDSTDVQKTAISIATGGQSAAIKNLETASIELENGTTITLKTADVNITISSAPGSVEIEAPNGGKVVIDRTGVKSTTGANEISMDATGVNLKGGVASVDLTPAGITLGYGGATLNAGPLVVNPAGIVQLG